MRTVFLLALLLASGAVVAPAQETPRFTRADTLRGSIGPARAWWDATFYDLHVRVSPADSSVRGRNGITYRVLRPAREMQIDLQEPLQVDSVVQDGRRLAFRRDGDAFFVTLASPQRAGETRTVTVHYHGRPPVAKNAPWDGGFVWTRDPAGDPWVATAVQGLGASAWWPTKDTQVEEPDSQRIAVTVPDPMVNVSNGRLRSTTRNGDGTTTYEWFVKNPINNYNVAVNAGTYAHFGDRYEGERGTLTLDYWPLAVNLEKARVQFQQVKPMLRCFEHWFGPYPWYEDGFKIVETPHLGMEHQSAIAYGNKYQNGYLGRDRSGTGHGLQWDFIIIHEAGHEWWGNNVTTRDIADMWVHESFTNYSEALYTECQQGKEAGFAYARGGRRNVQNDGPIVGVFGVNHEGSGDMYDKGGLMLHTIRQVIGDDAKWRAILRGLNSEFGRKTVTGRQVQEYISRESGIDLSRVFRQYLTTTMVPVLEYRMEGSTLSYRWANVVPGFDMPVRVTLSGDAFTTIRPTTAWKTARVSLPDPAAFRVDPNFYVDAKNVGAER
ncbi:MAG TPA: M1 family metallopeptidase [Longimicrobiaceae bacterium]|nr:M1 family metallopeptidase [Longimicrobiaceae bacterium]